MTLLDRNDAILVRIMRIKDEDSEAEMVSAYYTTAIDQTLRMFKTCKDYDISCQFNPLSEKVREDALSFNEYFIKDIWVTFGDEEDIPAIEVYI